jgi:hypothetical protein
VRAIIFVHFDRHNLQDITALLEIFTQDISVQSAVRCPVCVSNGCSPMHIFPMHISSVFFPVHAFPIVYSLSGVGVSSMSSMYL